MLVKTRCEKVRDALDGVADGTVVLDADEHEHVETCLRCQADLVQHRKVLRGLRNLRTEIHEPAPGLLGDILAQLEEAGERHAIRSVLTGRRVAYIGGIAAATAGAAAGAALLAARKGKLRIAS